MKKVGLFGGSFDPIHFGHLNLAFELMEKCGLDEVWFIPAKINPHKIKAAPLESNHRLAMVGLAIKDIPQFKVNDIEYHLPTPSYTLHTLQALLAQTREKECQFYLLLGEDSFSGFSQWYKPEEIVKLVPILVGSRTGEWANSDQLDIIKGNENKIRFVKTNLMDISSTDLRLRLSKKLYCGHLIPSEVLSYIHQNKLYHVRSKSTI
ncbi:MAG: nicotinate (nicotinamide) nucleotide adenylyltransferase [Parachlamydiaceae bacterium]|nr:nicotinate (nicotinamide) nucleotide adenylyltransferase [Parachlamydiaceae bacterium]